MKSGLIRRIYRYAASKSKLFLLTIALLIPSTSYGTRPLATDDAGTAGKGKTQVELGAEVFSWRDTVEDVRAKETGTAASGVFTYGLLENVDLAAGFPYAWSKVKEKGETVLNENGFSDISFEAKWRFYEKKGFGMALKPGITLPTGDHGKGFGTARVTYGLTFIASKEIDLLGFHFNAGYTRNENKVDKRKDLWSASAAVTYEVIKDLNVVGDIGLQSNADHAAKTAPAFALVGLNYTVTNHVMLDAGFKFGLNKQEVDHAAIAGVTFGF